MSREESFIERMVHGVERHIEQWREEDAARKTEVERHRDTLREEALERERMLAAESIGQEEARGLSPEQAALEHGAVFVSHSSGAGQALEGIASDGGRLARVIPGRGSGGRDAEVQGSWLLFERPR